MIGAIWQHESGINTIDYYGDAGPPYYKIHAWEGGGPNEVNNTGSAVLPVTYREPDLVVSNVSVPTAPIQAAQHRDPI